MSPLKKITRVFGGILFLAPFYHAIPASGASITLAWDPSNDPSAVGYKIYIGGTSGIYTNIINAGNATSVIIPGLVAGSTYYFTATAYNSLGLESSYTGEISYTPVATTLPTVKLRITAAKQVILTVTGQAGHVYTIEATQDFKTWTVIGTVTMGASGSLDFTDTNAASFSKRFYRTRG